MEDIEAFDDFVQTDRSLFFSKYFLISVMTPFVSKAVENEYF